MDRLNKIHEALECAIYDEIEDIENTNAEELGEAIDMLKDIAMTKYYLTVTHAMEHPEDYDIKAMSMIRP